MAGKKSPISFNAFISELDTRLTQPLEPAAIRNETAENDKECWRKQGQKSKCWYSIRVITMVSRIPKKAEARTRTMFQFSQICGQHSDRWPGVVDLKAPGLSRRPLR